ncbi:MAG: DUF262 domain-containing protein [Fusobacteriaceae bacterium]
MKAEMIPVVEFLGASKRIFNIPVYQRSYNWKQEQCKKLFDDILNMEYREKDGHFIGTIVYVDIQVGPTIKEFSIIDGQQRITTILLLIKALHDESSDEDLRIELNETYLINKGNRIEEKNRVKLKTVSNDSKIFSELISSEKFDIEESKGSKICENYKYFRERIKESGLSDEKILELITKLTMVYIMLDNNKEDPQLIFESLNSTGLNLTAADLIRNYILMGHSREKQEYLFSNYWEKLEKKVIFSEITDFIRDYLTLKTMGIPNKNNIYENFKDFCISESKKGREIDMVLEDINLYAKYYQWIKKYNSPYIEINKSLEDLEQLKTSVLIPFLFYLLSKFDNNMLDEEEVLKVLEIIKCYIIRRVICSIQTNALNKIFANLSKEIEENLKKEYSFSDSILRILLNKEASGTFPKDVLFKEHFIKKDMYNLKLKKYILEKIENRNEKEKIEIDNLTIEHIMPQKLTQVWKLELGKKYEEVHEKTLHTIGNLVLTGYNSELSNKSFEEKKEMYLTSNLKLTRELANYKQWDESSISERAEKILKIALEIWNIPILEYDFAIQQNLETRNEFDIEEEIDVTGKKPVQINIIGQTFSIKTWKEFFINICNSMCDLDEEKFYSFTTHSDFKGKEKRIISNKLIELREAEEIRKNIYIETNLNANKILNYSRLIIEKYNNEDIQVSYKIKN